MLGVPVDPTDPTIVLLSVVVGELLKKYAPSAYAKLSPVLPMLIVLFALAVRAVYDATATAEGVTWATVLRGLAAAGVAVLGHAQWRAVVKAVAGKSAPSHE